MAARKTAAAKPRAKAAAKPTKWLYTVRDRYDNYYVSQRFDTEQHAVDDLKSEVEGESLGDLQIDYDSDEIESLDVELLEVASRHELTLRRAGVLVVKKT